MRHHRAHKFCRHFLLGLFAFAVCVLTACIPSPTATPPRQTPFPTLPLLKGTRTPGFPPTVRVGTPHAVTPLPSPAATNVPIPTLSALSTDTLRPVVQITVQDPELPVSQGQQVPINVLAADNNIIARLELYDNDELYAQTAVIVPSAVYMNQFVWQADRVGTHSLRAVVYDAHGNASQPSEIALSVITNNRAPVVQITSPSGHKDAEIGAPILIQGVATDDVAVTRMELIVDNQLVSFAVPAPPDGTTPFAVAIPWTPMTTGAHNIVLRAYDNQNQSDDSLRYSIRVFDNQTPVVNAQPEHELIPPGEVAVIKALALANNGITRIELLADGRLADAVNSASPSQQTLMEATLGAADLGIGTHTLLVRAYDMTGHVVEAPPMTVQVRDGAPRIFRETLAPVTRTSVPPTRPSTPALVLPGAPTVELELVNAPVILPRAAQIRIRARGSAELDRVELWARLPGETTAQLLMHEVVKGATDKELMYDYNPPQAGVVEIYARVYDSLQQTQLSLPLRFSVLAPPAPTSVPAVFDFGRSWYAESPAARFEVEFVQIGRALRGEFLEQSADGKLSSGNIVSGAASDTGVVFAVDFAADATGSLHTLEFDCSFNARPPVLTCNYSTEKRERGSAVFQALGP